MAGEREGKLLLAAFEPTIILRVIIWGQRRVNFSTLPEEIQEKKCYLGAPLNSQIRSPGVFSCFAEPPEIWTCPRLLVAAKRRGERRRGAKRGESQERSSETKRGSRNPGLRQSLGRRRGSRT